MSSLPRRYVYIVYTESFVLGPFFAYDIVFVTPIEFPRASLGSFAIFSRFFQALEGCQKTLGEDDLDAPVLFRVCLSGFRIVLEGFGRSGSKKSS